MLIEAGATVDAIGCDRWTPLHHASWNARDAVCWVLIEAGAALDERDGYQKTPLHRAATIGAETTCLLLIEAGAEVDAGGDYSHVLKSVDNSSIIALIARASEIRRAALTRQQWAGSRGTEARFRRAHDAHRDARLVFRAAAQGRPLELQKRLVLGKLAGGTERLCEVDGVMMTPIDAAMASGHEECIEAVRSIRHVTMRSTHTERPM